MTGVVSPGPLSPGDVALDTPDRTTVPFPVSLLALASVPGLGSRGLRAVAEELGGDLSRLWQMLPPQIERLITTVRLSGGARIARDVTGRSSTLLSRADDWLSDLSRKGIQIIGSTDLPPALREIPDAPRWVFFQGDRAVLYHLPSAGGRRRGDAEALSDRAEGGVLRCDDAGSIFDVLASGLAEGVGEEAPRASLREGGKTLAFLGHGLDVVFPASTAWIRDQIVEEGGGVATEYLSHEHPRASDFVQRNRLQAALADLVIPIETRQEGGTAHTIRFARRYRRRILVLRWTGAGGAVERLAGGDAWTIDIGSLSGWEELDRIVLGTGGGARPSDLLSVGGRAAAPDRSQGEGRQTGRTGDAQAHPGGPHDRARRRLRGSSSTSPQGCPRDGRRKGGLPHG